MVDDIDLTDWIPGLSYYRSGRPTSTMPSSSSVSLPRYALSPDNDMVSLIGVAGVAIPLFASAGSGVGGVATMGAFSEEAWEAVGCGEAGGTEPPDFEISRKAAIICVRTRSARSCTSADVSPTVGIGGRTARVYRSA